MSTITVNSLVLPNWQYGGSTAKLRIFLQNAFVSSAGIPLQASAPGNGSFYKDVTVTISGTNATVDSFTLDSTTDGLDIQSARYSAFFYSSSGQRLRSYESFSNFAIGPSPTTVDWDDIRTFNFQLQPNRDLNAYTKAQSDARYATIGSAGVADPGSSGLMTRTALNVSVARTLTGPAAGLSITNGDGVSGNPTFSLANDLAALEGLGSTGLAVRTASDTWAQRTITGTSNRLDVTNGNGVSGNPTLDISSAYVGQATITTLGVVTTMRVNQPQTTNFWLDAHTAIINRVNDRLFIGGASANDGNVVNLASDWLETLIDGVTSNAQIATLNTRGLIAGTFGTRSSDFGGSVTAGTIAVAGVAINDNASFADSGYGGYFEAWHTASSIGAATHGVEIDVVSLGTSPDINPYSMAPTGLTNALWLASGATRVGSNDATVALGIRDNGNTTPSSARFKKGIVFGATGLVGTDGTGTGAATAIEMARGQEIVWRNASGVYSTLDADFFQPVNGYAIRTGTVAADTVLFQARNTGGSSYTTLLKLVAHASAPKLVIPNAQPLYIEDSGATARIILNLQSDNTLRIGGGLSGTVFTAIRPMGDTGAILFQSSDGVTACGNVSNAGNWTFLGTLTAGSGPTTLTDAAGKVLSAALNTVGAAQGGTGLTSYAVGDLIYASGATTLAKLADVAVGSALVSGGVTTAPAYAAFGSIGASWVLISSQAASSSAEIDFTGLGDTYDAYVITLSSIKPATDDTGLLMRIQTGGSTWQAGAAAYGWSGDLLAAATTTPIGDASDSGIALSATGGAIGVGNASGENLSGWVQFNNPEATDFCNFTTHVSYNRAADGFPVNNAGGGAYLTAGAITGVRFLFSSGNIASGRFALYGLRKA